MPANEIQITIGSIQFNQSLSYDSNFYLLKNTPEILSTLSTRKTDMEKQSEHGVEDSLSFYDARMLPFEGTIYGSTQAARKTMEEALKQAVALPISQSYGGSDGYVLVLITDEDGTEKQIYAKVLEPPKFGLVDDAMPELRSFEFVLYAKDPVIYGQSLTTETGPESYLTTTFTIQDGALPTVQDGDLPTIQESTGSILTVSNGGTIGSPPTITISGPTTDPVVSNLTTGKSMDFSKGGGVSLGAGDTLTVNVSARTIVKTSGGTDTDVSGALTDASDWIFIEPGDNEFTLFDDSPGDLSGQMQIDVRPAWI